MKAERQKNQYRKKVQKSPPKEYKKMDRKKLFKILKNKKKIIVRKKLCLNYLMKKYVKKCLSSLFP